MNNLDYIPETLEQCEEYYLPPIAKYISCEEFGNIDGMSGGCHWCSKMTPYQWWMCRDESQLRRLVKPRFNRPALSKEDAIKYIEKYKKRVCKCSKEE